MDKIPAWSALFVSFPEELLIVLITLSVAGYRDVIDFKDKNNLAKLLGSTSLMVISSVAGRFLLPSVTLNSIIQAIIFYLIIVVIYKYNPFSCLAGFMLSLTLLVVSEAIFLSLSLTFFKLTPFQAYSNTLFAVLFSLPDRIIQIAALIVICKKKDLRLRFEKLSISEWISIALYCLIIFANMFSLEIGFSIIQSSGSKIILSLILNIGMAIIFSSWLIYSIFKVRQKVILNEKMRTFELMSIRKLLSEGHIDHVIDLIDHELISREYNKK